MTGLLEIVPDAAHALHQRMADPDAGESYEGLVLLVGLQELLAEAAPEGRASLAHLAGELAANLPPGLRCSQEDVARWLGGRLAA
jgi:hypothetical protein